MDQAFSSTSVTFKVVSCQQPLHEPLSEQTLEQIAAYTPDFVALPEHYPLPQYVRDIEQAASLFDIRKEYLQSLSMRLSTVLVGGTLTERSDKGYYNTCYVFDRGNEAGSYRKVYPTNREVEAGILKGTEFKMFEISGLRVGVLICADVLFERSFHELRQLNCQITFVPTASPYRAGESWEEKYQRDRSIFVEGAQKMSCPIVKTCGVGTTFGHPIQGRSLIATPDRVLVRAEPPQENLPLLLFAELKL